MKLPFIPKKKNSILPFCQQTIILFLGLILLFYILVIGSNDRDRFLAVHCCETNMCNAGHRSSTGGRAALALLLATSFRFFFFFFRYWSRGLSPAAAATPHHIFFFFFSLCNIHLYISVSLFFSLSLCVCVCVCDTRSLRSVITFGRRCVFIFHYCRQIRTRLEYYSEVKLKEREKGGGERKKRG